ncbi:hypothetical protein [Pseudarthrobacter sp. B4EP4b]|uniref:hypothetical protein n=1 Tax=Pseudarthrobacter sp. B4EP4b TaxID=2590664 RepID=UPI00115208F1|nr:hypothetical protein [Pseudarthrobacter sp. B4EP4b]
MSTTEQDFTRRISGLRSLQEAYAIPVRDLSRQNPTEALHSLRETTSQSRPEYRDYLNEAVDCYENRCYRGAVLMVWSAVMEHLYQTIEAQVGGVKMVEAANSARFGNAQHYKRIKKRDDLLYLSDSNFFMICEDAGLFNKNARLLLIEKLDLRNRCGHPTKYVVAREETVIFIESLINNVLNGAMLNWPRSVGSPKPSESSEPT